jgi:hypothetical protein
MSRWSSVLILVLLTSEAFAAPSAVERVYNGEFLTPSAHKHLVALQMLVIGASDEVSAILKGSGSIINANWIVTAANRASLYPRITAYQDTNAYSGVVASVDSNRIYVNPNFVGVVSSVLFNDPYISYDIALLNTNEPIIFNDFVQPIKLSFVMPDMNQPGVVAGYGMNEKGKNYPTQGRVGIYRQCSAPHTVMNALCTNGDVYPDFEDVGGPLVSENLLVGVFVEHYKHTLDDDNRHGVSYYSSIAYNEEWIKSIVDPDNEI